ncbi:MAG TPA: hypothetical protein VGQ15_00790 [Gaiellaceae bacterium]|nr:hypothetical protein [Gaiellaceae bacterium]
MLELWSAARAFEALEAYLADALRPGLVAALGPPLPEPALGPVTP